MYERTYVSIHDTPTRRDVGDNEITQIRAGDFAGLTQLLYL